jgi:hypothetical protein
VAHLQDEVIAVPFGDNLNPERQSGVENVQQPMS